MKTAIRKLVDLQKAEDTQQEAKQSTRWHGISKYSAPNDPDARKTHKCDAMLLNSNAYRRHAGHGRVVPCIQIGGDLVMTLSIAISLARWILSLDEECDD